MDTLLGAANGLVGVAGGAVGVVGSLLDRVESVRLRKLSSQNRLRAYYLEVVGNLETLRAVNLKKLCATPINSQGMTSFLDKLSCEIGLSLLFSEDEDSRVFEFLKTRGKIDNANGAIMAMRGGKEVSGAGKAVYENVLQAVSFTVQKTDFLRKLAHAGDDELSFYNRLMIERRLVNLRERYAMIKRVMDSMEGVKEMAR